MNEEWKDVPNYEGVYLHSNFGRTKRLYKNGKQRILKPFVENGYYHVKLSYKGIENTWKVHRLTATVWMRPLKESDDVHHKNGLVWCNAVFNLQIIPHPIHVKYHWDELKTNGKCKNMKGNKGKCSNKKRVISEETRKKMSESHKGKHLSEESKRKMIETRNKNRNKINMEVY